MPASRAQRTETAKRRSQALALRAAGMDLDTIATRLGYAGATEKSRRANVSKDLARALEGSLEEQRQQAELLRAMELSRLDWMQAGLWPAAASGDARAVGMVLGIMDRRKKYLRLDEQTGNSEYAISVLGQLAAGLGLADAKLQATGAYAELAAPEGVLPDGVIPDDDGYVPPADDVPAAADAG